MKRFSFLILCLGIVGLARAQQQEHYSMYMQNNFLVNPAEGGTEEFIDIKLGYRNQWVSVPGAPQSFFLSGHAAVGKKTSRFDDVRQLPYHGVGGAIISDNIGPFNIITAKGAYSYHLPVSDDLIMSVGAFLGVKQYQIDNDDIQFDKNENFTDPVESGLGTATAPDVSVGIWGYADRYYFGISTFQILNNKVNISDDFINDSQLSMHHWATAGYRIPMGENFNLIPSFVVKFVEPAPVTFDVNAKFRYKDDAWLGVSYRNQDAVIGIVGVTIKNLIDVAYSYDFTTSSFSAYNNGTHEILLGLRLPNQEHEPPPAQFW